jgi:hypothetical protein
LIAEVCGISVPTPYSRRFPGMVDWVTVVFRTIDVAPAGTPH